VPIECGEIVRDISGFLSEKGKSLN
jgi:hypothetical protein